jgi:ATP-dependent DNA ligase
MCAFYSRNAYDWAVRLSAIAAAAERINAKTFTIDGDREAARTAIVYAFDLIEHDGEDLRNLPFLDRKATLTRLLRKTKAGSMAPTNPARAAWIKVRNPASIAVQRERSEIWNRRASGSATVRR